MVDMFGASHVDRAGMADRSAVARCCPHASRVRFVRGLAAWQEYIVRDDEVLIVDTFSGRVLEGRRYSDGLHQCIEAKEGGWRKSRFG